MAREIQKQAWFVDAGLGKDLLQSVLAQVIPNEGFKEIGDADLLQRQFTGIERIRHPYAAADRDGYLTSTIPQFPSVHCIG